MEEMINKLEIECNAVESACKEHGYKTARLDDCRNTILELRRYKSAPQTGKQREILLRGAALSYESLAGVYGDIAVTIMIKSITKSLRALEEAQRYAEELMEAKERCFRRMHILVEVI
jgi:hypothetical protein